MSLEEDVVLPSIRRLLLALLILLLAGTAVDLLLLDHYEEAWQLLPLALIAVALVIAAWTAATGGAAAVAALRITMLLFIPTGLLGILMHYNGSREFQTEIDPALAGWALFFKVVRAKAPPALAPAVMVQMGLLGLLYTYRHPALQRRLVLPNEQEHVK
jgi:hypothetical protein